jgi:hypothetical protein
MKITPKQRFTFQIAAEKIIIDITSKNEPWSSRVLADEIVNMVLNTLERKRKSPKGKELKPWLAFGFKSK